MSSADYEPDYGTGLVPRRGLPARRGGLDLAVQGGRDVGMYDDYPVMEEPGFNLAHYLDLLWKHKFLIGSIVAFCLAIGVAVTLLATPEYTATATLQIDRESAKIVDVKDVTPTEQAGNSLEFYQTQYELLKSRSLADRVVKGLGLVRSDVYLKAVGLDKVKPERNAPADKRVAFERQVLASVQGRLVISPVRGSRLVKISFSSYNAGVSAQIVNGITDGFIASNLERRFDSSSYARDFLEKRLAQVKSRLEDSERQLVAYAASQEIISLNEVQGEGGMISSQSLGEANLQATNSQLAAITSERVAAEQTWRQAAAATGRGIPQVLASPLIQQLSQTRASRQADYDDKLQLYKPDYPEMRALRGQIVALDGQIQGEVENIKRALRAEYEALLVRENTLKSQISGLKGDVLQYKDKNIQYRILQREADTNRTLYEGLLQRYKEVGVTGGVTTNNISVVDAADAPLSPSKPRPLINLALAGILGVALGVGAALAVEALDQAIRRPTDLEAKVGIPLLGSTPMLAKGVTPAEAMRDLRSDFWESYSSIRTAMQFTTADGFPKTLLVTSSSPSEGKSTTSFAIAQSMARLGLKTLLVDGDLRKPSLHNTLGVQREFGLSTYLNGTRTLDTVLQPTTLPGLSFISAGPQPPTPGELLAGGRLRAFLAEAQDRFEIVIIDGPPVMGLADAPTIGALVHGTIVVVEAGRTGRNQVKATMRRLRSSRSRILGAVLTKFDARKHSTVYGYGEYEYKYNYGKE